MEKTISQEERIRRAEEIYNRRKLRYSEIYNKKILKPNGNEYRNESLKSRLIKKILIQIAVCMMIYLGLYALVNYDNIFSENIQTKINDFLSYDVSIEKMFDTINDFFKSDANLFFFLNGKENVEEKSQEKNNTENLENNQVEKNDENKEPKEDYNNNIENSDNNEGNINETLDGIGGAETEQIVVDTRSQEEIDADYIKNNYGIIWPVNGVITSRYGPRTPTDIVTANHYGLDIGANIGTPIVAAMDGTVAIASSYGEYGKHIQIENGEISTLYAHCNVLCVTSGESVSKGQKIAEVGKTGRATGPHLHFEVKRNGQSLDPELVLE